MNLRLIRLEENYEWGTYGSLLVASKVFCATLEPRDEENVPFISSIPAQQYFCKKVDSPKYGKTWEVLNVPGRTSILFHPGNTVDHTEGCIILGQYWGKLESARAILNSGKTFLEFMELTKHYDILQLTVKEHY